MAINELKLDRGTAGVVNLNDGVNYALLYGAWKPRAARRRAGMLGGQGLFEDVEEVIPLRIFGTSGSAALNALQTLVETMGQVQQWAAGEIVDPVVLTFKPDGSGFTNAVKALVLDIPGNAADLLDLPITFNENLKVFEIVPVNLQLVRRGLWLGDVETDLSEEAVPPNIVTVNLTTDVKTPSPTRIEISGITWKSAPGLLQHGALLVTNHVDKIWLVQGENMTASSSGGSNVLDANASGGYFRRIAANAANQYFEGALPSAKQTVLTRAHVFVCIRNSGTPIDWLIRATMRAGNIQKTTASTRWVSVPTSDTNPHILYLGSMRTKGVHEALRLEFSPSSASGTEYLEIDYVVVLMDDETSYTIELVNCDLEQITGTYSIVVDPRALENDTPEVYIENITNQIMGYSSYAGDAYISMLGASVYASLLATHGTSWLFNGTAGTVALSPTRRPGYVVPK